MDLKIAYFRTGSLVTRKKIFHSRLQASNLYKIRFETSSIRRSKSPWRHISLDWYEWKHYRENFVCSKRSAMKEIKDHDCSKLDKVLEIISRGSKVDKERRTAATTDSVDTKGMKEYFEDENKSNLRHFEFLRPYWSLRKPKRRQCFVQNRSVRYSTTWWKVVWDNWRRRHINREHDCQQYNRTDFRGAAIRQDNMTYGSLCRNVYCYTVQEREETFWEDKENKKNEYDLGQALNETGYMTSVVTLEHNQTRRVFRR